MNDHKSCPWKPPRSGPFPERVGWGRLGLFVGKESVSGEVSWRWELCSLSIIIVLCLPKSADKSCEDKLLTTRELSCDFQAIESYGSDAQKSYPLKGLMVRTLWFWLAGVKLRSWCITQLLNTTPFALGGSSAHANSKFNCKWNVSLLECLFWIIGTYCGISFCWSSKALVAVLTTVACCPNKFFNSSTYRSNHGRCWFHRLRNVVSSNKGIFLIDDDQEAGIASKTDGG